MKTSTILAIAGILGAFATNTAIDLKIKNDYSKGKIQSAYVQTKLPPFRFIKEKLDSATGMPTVFNVNVGKGNKPGVEVYYSLPLGYRYTVVNDTLIIGLDPLDKEGYRWGTPVIINVPALEGIDVSKGLYYVTDSDSGMLSVKTTGKSAVNLKLEKINKLVLDGSEKSKISIVAKEPIDEAVMRFTGKSILSIDGAVISRKTVQFGENMSLHLSGPSLESFRIRQQ